MVGFDFEHTSSGKLQLGGNKQLYLWNYIMRVCRMQCLLWVFYYSWASEMFSNGAKHKVCCSGRRIVFTLYNKLNQSKCIIYKLRYIYIYIYDINRWYSCFCTWDRHNLWQLVSKRDRSALQCVLKTCTFAVSLCCRQKALLELYSPTKQLCAERAAGPFSSSV